MLLLLLVACSGNKPRAKEDAAAVRPDTHAIDAAAPAVDAPPASNAKTGDLQVRVEWRDVPVPMRASPGRTACKTPRAPVVAPTTTWGIPEIVVIVSGATLPAAPARIVLADCALAPRIVAATAAVVESAVDRPSKITFAKRGDIASLDKLEKGTPRPVQLPIAGHAVTLPLDANGVYELAADGETAWVIASPAAGVTEPNGQLLVKDLAPGKYDVTAWLPPRAGGAAKLKRGTVTVEAGDLADITLALE
jgi:hypothetical protein